MSTAAALCWRYSNDQFRLYRRRYAADRRPGQWYDYQQRRHDQLLVRGLNADALRHRYPGRLSGGARRGRLHLQPAGSDATAGGTDTSRTISWTVTDGSNSNGISNTATSTLAVPATPVVTATQSNVPASAEPTLHAARNCSVPATPKAPPFSPTRWRTRAAARSRASGCSMGRCCRTVSSPPFRRRSCRS